MDFSAFRDFERAGWNSSAETYDRFFTAISEHNIEPLLDDAGVRPGAAVLDAGCGPGSLATAASSRQASVVGIDLSDVMVAIAKARHPDMEFRQADAEDLPFADRTFDAVVANLLVPHLPNPEAAVLELARVLKSRGKLALSMWDAPERSRLLGIMWEAIAEVGAPLPADLPSGPATLKFSDEGEFKGLLLSAGLDDVTLRRVEFNVSLRDTDELWVAWTQGSVRTRSAVMDQPLEVQRRIRAAFERRAALYAGSHGLNVPVSFLIASGQRA